MTTNATRFAQIAKRVPFFGVSHSRPLSVVSNREKAWNMAGNFKNYVQKYGWTFVGTYLSVYITTLGSVYLALDFDVFRASDFGLDAKSLTQKVRFCSSSSHSWT
jgi:hypothetical protein